MDLNEICLTVPHPWADRGQAQCVVCYGRILHRQMQQGRIKHPRGNQKPQMGNTCGTHLATIESQGKWNPSAKRILEDTCINENLLYKKMCCPSRLGLFERILIRKDFYTKEEMSTFYYYKSHNTLTNQGTHNLPFSSTLEL